METDPHHELPLVGAIRACRICAGSFALTATAHEPRPVVWFRPGVRLLIAGQAPGARVHESGRPFTDASGDRLRDWMGVTRAEFYDPRLFAILPMGFCFPGQDAKGGDLPPRKECAPAWRASLLALMPHIELVLAVGGYAQKWHLGGRIGPSLTETMLNWRSIFEQPDVPRVMPLPHPSWRNTVWLKRHPWFEADLLPVLKAEIRHRI